MDLWTSSLLRETGALLCLQTVKSFIHILSYAHPEYGIQICVQNVGWHSFLYMVFEKSVTAFRVRFPPHSFRNE